MEVLPERHAIAMVVQKLVELLDAPAETARIRKSLSLDERQIDAIADIGSFAFVIEYKNSGGTSAVSMAIRQVQQYASGSTGCAIPLIAVPYMGAVGQRLCEESQVAWLDLSGNAHIRAPGLLIHIEGRPNQFKRRGRPSNAFAPKSSRITRWLLMHAGQPMTQREIARATAVDEGFTSRIVHRLEADRLVARSADGTIRVPDPDLLLEAWLEKYDFNKHRIVRGHISTRSSNALLHALSSELNALSIPYALTGLGAAWLLTHYAGFRIVTIYLGAVPSSSLLGRLSFRAEDRGANVWLVIPNDEGVFHGASDREGVHCVHPLQAYVDLKNHPERAQAAAERLRSEFLNWKSYGSQA